MLLLLPLLPLLPLLLLCCCQGSAATGKAAAKAAALTAAKANKAAEAKAAALLSSCCQGRQGCQAAKTAAAAAAPAAADASAATAQAGCGDGSYYIHCCAAAEAAAAAAAQAAAVASARRRGQAAAAPLPCRREGCWSSVRGKHSGECSTNSRCLLDTSDAAQGGSAQGGQRRRSWAVARADRSTARDARSAALAPPSPAGERRESLAARGPEDAASEAPRTPRASNWPRRIASTAFAPLQRLEERMARAAAAARLGGLACHAQVLPRAT
jgi:hypothetical protein